MAPAAHDTEYAPHRRHRRRLRHSCRRVLARWCSGIPRGPPCVLALAEATCRRSTRANWWWAGAGLRRGSAATEDATEGADESTPAEEVPRPRESEAQRRTEATQSPQQPGSRPPGILYGTGVAARRGLVSTWAPACDGRNDGSGMERSGLGPTERSEGGSDRGSRRVPPGAEGASRPRESEAQRRTEATQSPQQPGSRPPGILYGTGVVARRGLDVTRAREWWAGADLNRRPPHFQCGALPTELPAPMGDGRLARAAKGATSRAGFAVRVVSARHIG